ncbi:MAG: ECF-type sigma factor [Acidobacteriota bacterium]|nr:ECF-type sigma factor [Acidobacteriota bacterium]
MTAIPGAAVTPLPPPIPPGEITGLLASWHRGDKQALNHLFELVYDELRKTARGCLREEHEACTLHPTSLINEAFLRLKQNSRLRLANRLHFYWFAAQTMRRILVEQARARTRLKRNSGAMTVSLDDLDESEPGLELDPGNVISLDQALKRLERMDARYVRIIELRFFAGLSVPEIAETLSVSTATVKREWAAARLWLARELSGVKRAV